MIIGSELIYHRFTWSKCSTIFGHRFHRRANKELRTPEQCLDARCIIFYINSRLLFLLHYQRRCQIPEIVVRDLWRDLDCAFAKIFSLEALVTCYMLSLFSHLLQFFSITDLDFCLPICFSFLLPPCHKNPGTTLLVT
jgi:hypothetical protein